MKEPARDVLDAFQVKGEITALPGGQNTSCRAGGVVLKQVDGDTAFAEWSREFIAGVTPRGYRLLKPIRSTGGTFVYEGWCCSRYEPGEHRRGSAEQKLGVSRLLHRDIGGMDFWDMPMAHDRWSKAHRVAWQEESLPGNIPAKAAALLKGLLSAVRPGDAHRAQVIHADLSGNILFDEALSPLIIDFSPAIAPVAYAEAILVCDCIAWEGSPLSDIALIGHAALDREMILRAILFRLTVAATFAGANALQFDDEYRCFKPIIDCVL